MNNIYDPEFVRQLFNRMSDSYDRMNYITSFGFSVRWRNQFLAKPGQPEAPVIILGLLSGRRKNPAFLKRRFPESDFYALDFSEQMIVKSKEKG